MTDTATMVAHAGPYVVFVGDNSVYFEHHRLGEDDGICVYHDSDKRVYDYDMAYGMCDAVRQWLDSNGYNTEEILG